MDKEIGTLSKSIFFLLLCTAAGVVQSVRATETKSVLGPNCMIKYVKIGVCQKRFCLNVLINTEGRKAIPARFSP